MWKRFSDYRKLRSEADTRHLAWPMLKSYLVYMGVFLVCCIYLVPLWVFGLIALTLDGISNALERRAYPKFLTRLRNDYKDKYKAGHDAYAPYRVQK